MASSDSRHLNTLQAIVLCSAIGAVIWLGIVLVITELTS